MKIRFYLATAIVALSWMGCSQEEATNEIMSGANVIQATIESSSRSAVTDAGVFSWTTDDEISLLDVNNKDTYTYSGTGNGFNPPASVTVSTPVVAYYPANENHTTTKFYLPVTYGNTATEYVASTNAAMIATPPTTGNTYAFMHLGGVMRFNVKNVPVNADGFRFSVSGKKITGEFEVKSGTTKTIETENDPSSNNTVTIRFKTLTEAKDMTFYVPMPTGTYNDYTVGLFIDGDLSGHEHTSTNVTNTIARKTLLLMPTFTWNGTSLDKGEAIAGVIDLEDGSKEATIEDDAEVVVTPGTNADAVATLNYTPADNGSSALSILDGSGATESGESEGKVLVSTADGSTVASCDINTPSMTVELSAVDNGAATYNEVTALTANQTLIIGEGVTVKKLIVKGGNVIVYGQVDKISSEVATTIKLENDITLTAPVRIGKEVTIDLNGHSITSSTEWPTENTEDAMFIVNRNGVLTIDDSSTEKSGSIIANSEELSCAIKLTEKADDQDATNYAKVVLNAGTLDGKEVVTYGIGGNGNPGRGNTNVEMNGGKINGFDYGIFNPQENGSVTIKNGVIATKKAAIEMRSGNLEIIDGEFSATITPEDANPNGNGTTIEGAAIAISQHTTNHDLSATIKGGTFKGIYALYEEDLQDEQVENISLSVIGGTFNGKVYSENCESFISGGTFNDGSVFGDNYFATSANITLGANITIAPNTVIPTGVTIDGSTQKYSVNTTIEADDASTGIGKGVFNLAGGTIKNISFTSSNTQYDIIVTAGGSVIEGCNFPTATIEAMGKGKRAIFTDRTIELSGDLTVKSCTFDDKVYAFNFSNANNKMDITFEGCTLGGWLSGHGKSHTFTNCTFTKSGDYANYIPYCPATFNGCSFDEGFAISLKKGSTYTFDNNCKYNEAVVTGPSGLKWDFSGGTTGEGDNGTSETVVIGGQSWTNNVPEGTGGEEAIPNWEEYQG